MVLISIVGTWVGVYSVLRNQIKDSKANTEVSTNAKSGNFLSPFLFSFLYQNEDQKENEVMVSGNVSTIHVVK